MAFSLANYSKDIDIMQEIFTHISRYSNGEIIITDSKFNILFHNLKRFQNKKKLNLFDISNNLISDKVKLSIENFKHSTNNHFFIKLIFKDNEALQDIPVDIHICKIKNNKDIIKGYSILIQDISQEIRNKILKETFVDIISHDLKNPMRANIQILELILKNKFGKIENNLKVVLEELLSSCRFMNYMADNLLIKYKNEFDLYELQKEKYSILKLIKEQCNKLAKFLDRKKQIIELIIKGNIDDIEMDIEEMSKVINNLIINASEQSIENAKIKIKVEKNKNNIRISFVDYGYPQKQEVLNGIFEEYVICSNKFRKIGFGLELYNCRKIIEAHNGKIYAENKSNTGNIITFILPV